MDGDRTSKLEKFVEILELGVTEVFKRAVEHR